MQAPAPPQAPPATWTRANKDSVGSTLQGPRVWFTAAEGMLTEVFYPRIDIPQLKLLNFIIADDAGFWCELGGMDGHVIEEPMVGVPALIVRHRHPRFEFTLKICPDPARDVILIDAHLEGDPTLRPYAYALPRVGENAEHNQAAIGQSANLRALLAWQGPFGLALMAAHEGEDGWRRLSVGHLEASDLASDFRRHGRMTWTYDQAGPGQVVLGGELPRRVTLALGFCTSAQSAATLAHSALVDPFDDAWDTHIRQWRSWLAQIIPPEGMAPRLWAQLLRSAMVLKTHKDHTFTGAMVASLSTPWGHVSTQRGGYHLVWARDLVESAGAFFALALPGEAHEVLRYLIATQQPDGHWHQNQWLGGKPYWSGIQLDEVGFPVLLAAKLAACDALGGTPVLPMIRAALRFLLLEGPVSPQDRWEEDPGLNAFTLAVIIAALVEGAAFLDQQTRDFVLGLADEWNACIEDWLYVSGTAIAARIGVHGYYVRIAPPEVLDDHAALAMPLPIRNRADGAAPPAADQVALDFLQLVRFGLRRADDVRIRDTLKVADALLKVDTPCGPVWHRYTGDGYGEHADGTPYDGTGIGRGWPLLTGERGHYALAAGEDAQPYLEAMDAMAGRGGLLPEQVWDTDPIPALGLFPGRPTGSVQPLVWAHGEFIKLAYSQAAGHAIDRPEGVWQRYGGKVPRRPFCSWNPRHPHHRLPQGLMLRLVLPAPALVHFGYDDWHTPTDVLARDCGLDVWYVDLPTADLAVGQRIVFTFQWQRDGRWEGRDYALTVVPAAPDAQD
ncbi:glycoside hydrolase family 15 protein [Aerosticca soli]|uniref:Glucoamylase n=1 Tax=Aerosticca soli TaxID=2010829 RepID=A0A2Z6E5T6_9GAMM|nr:glycoside hydrolase family 15 protein [Aerosticca soli]BBD80272.1 glucoamylase [Aerosticca soli]